MQEKWVGATSFKLQSLFGNFFRQIMFGEDLYLGGAK